MPWITHERINMTAINGHIVSATVQVWGKEGWQDVRPVEVSEDGSTVYYDTNTTLIGPPMKPAKCLEIFKGELTLKEQANG